MIHTYTVFETLSGRTAIVIARSEDRAVQLAKSHHNMPVNGQFITTKIN